MQDITFKIASRGEGKTKWLLDIAHQYSNTDRPVYLCTDMETVYGNFCEKYFRTYNSICTVQKLTLNQLTGNEIVLIDDLMSLTTCSFADIAYIKRNCYKMFVTIEGNNAENEINEIDHNQLSIFDNYEVVFNG